MRWIETRDLFFEQYKSERSMEVGPSPTLVSIVVHTLKAKYETKDDSTGHVRRVFCATGDEKEIYYQFEDEPEATSEPDAPAESANPASALVAAAPVVVAAPPPTANAGPAASIEDVPIRAVDIFAVIVSRKLKKQLSEVPRSKLIKELSNGKSTLQNEIMGDF
jgi:fatty acid synthase subunit alpha, fungi type